VALSLLGGVVGTVGSLVLTVVQFLVPHSRPGAEDKLKELDRVRASLSQLAQYVQEQQQELSATASNLATLRRQKEDLDRVVGLNRESVEALLRVQDQRQGRATLFGYAISFVLGVFSSWTASSLRTFLRSRRRNRL
jgi:hypothetical protein